MNCAVQNEGTIDRLFRGIIGILAFIVGTNTAPGVMQTVIFVVGLIGVMTAMTGVCPLYQLFHISTKTTKNR